MTSRTSALTLPAFVGEFLLVFFLAAGALMPMMAQAQTTPVGRDQNPPSVSPVGRDTNTSNSGGGMLENPLNVSSLPELINIIIQGIVQLAGIALTVALVIVGFRFVAAQGNQKKLQDARTALMWTLLGGLILLGASGISALVANTVQNISS